MEFLPRKSGRVYMSRRSLMKIGTRFQPTPIIAPSPVQAPKNTTPCWDGKKRNTKKSLGLMLDVSLRKKSKGLSEGALGRSGPAHVLDRRWIIYGSIARSSPIRGSVSRVSWVMCFETLVIVSFPQIHIWFRISQWQWDVWTTVALYYQLRIAKCTSIYIDESSFMPIMLINSSFFWTFYCFRQVEIITTRRCDTAKYAQGEWLVAE